MSKVEIVDHAPTLSACLDIVATSVAVSRVVVSDDPYQNADVRMHIAGP